MTLNDIANLNPQNRGLSDFSAIFGCSTHFNSELSATKWVEMDQDKLRTEIAIGYRASHEFCLITCCTFHCIRQDLVRRKWFSFSYLHWFVKIRDFRSDV